MKEVFYLAHPVSGDPLGNCEKAEAWIRWLTLNEPSRVYVAPWVAEVRAFAAENNLPTFYDRVLADDQDVVRHLDGILLVGGTISKGMQLELDAAVAKELLVVDWSEFAAPADLPSEAAEILRDADDLPRYA